MSMISISRYALMASAIFTAANVAGAAVVLESNFESPTYTTGALVPQDAWVNDGGQARYSVVSNTVPGFGAAGAQTAAMAGGEGGEWIRKFLSTWIDAGDWYFEALVSLDAGKTTRLWVDNSGSSAGTMVGFVAGGAIEYWDGAGIVTSASTFTDGQVISIRQDIHFGTGLYDLYLNNVLLAGNLDMRGTPGVGNAINALELQSAGGTTSDISYLDNVRLSDVPPIPEPASASLIGLASLGFLARRRSR